ncbi:hypothetical protein [Qipengyuania spongiae]|uniref:Uncharacterized protein n=1 Tax=Qipengyuania spongiae TaxID=2909673 RepID=A0ABY5T2R2_9SPHN|nr:hypothetical protein [Qipengyuania spongiae]UVI39631.1 hypothetical protein L1F33_01305 [Qipengyuania spongiae]
MAKSETEKWPLGHGAQRTRSPFAVGELQIVPLVVSGGAAAKGIASPRGRAAQLRGSIEHMAR